MHNFSNLFWYGTLHGSHRVSVHHQESSTVHIAMGICPTADSQHNLYAVMYPFIYIRFCFTCVIV